MMRSRWLRGAVGIGIAFLACRASEEGAGIEVPDGFPAPRIPAENAFSVEKAELGRFLFYDKRLSANEAQSCASCHHQERAFTDGLTTAVGSTGQRHPRNSQTLANVAYNATLTWANPVLTDLEQQILVPIFGEEPVELGVTAHEDEVLQRFQSDAEYKARFSRAFPGERNPVHFRNIVHALATFVRTMVSGDSPYDRFVHRGDKLALSPEAQRGMDLFFSERLECHHCHNGFNLTESSAFEGSTLGLMRFHNTGLYNIDGKGAYPADNTGVFAVTGKPEDMGRFRPPTLRNVGVTAPYMHDGSFATLEEVVRFYEAGGRTIADGPYAGDGRASPLKSGLVAGFSLTDGERNDLIAFLESLTDQTFLHDPRLSDPFIGESP